jgi:polysaccharide biosynthesis protein PslG
VAITPSASTTDAPTDVPRASGGRATRVGSRCFFAVALALVVALAAGCSGSDQTAPTTFTVPRISPLTTTSTTTTTSTSTTTTTLPPPRAERAGLSPGFGLTSLPPPEFNATLDAIAATDVGWLRVDFDWSVIQAAGPATFDWSRTDRIVQGARARDLSIVALLAYTPPWARPYGSPDKNPPTNPDDFARFAIAAAQRYAPLGVTTWEIWNEPNVSTFWYPRPDAQAYTALLVRASAAIKVVEPHATVITGGLAPSSDNASGSEIDIRTFLTRVYAAGGGRAFDAVGLHPYSFPQLPTYPADYNTFLAAPALYQVMVDHGDAAKRIWGTEIGAPTAGGGGSVSEAVQAQIIALAYRQWNAWRFTGPLIWFSYADAGSDPYNRDDHFGLLDAAGRQKPGFAVFVAVVRALLARQHPRPVASAR